MHWLDAASFAVRFGAGLLAGLWLWALATDLGSLIVGKTLPGLARAPARIVGAALGYALIGSAVALLGLLHAARAPYLIGLLGAITIARSPAYLRVLGQMPAHAAAVRAWWTMCDGLEKAAWIVAATAIGTAAVAAALPAVWWDPLAYHLPLAARALQSGAFGFDPAMVQSAFPQLAEAAALPAYALAGSAGAAFATLGAGIALMALCAVTAQRVAPGSGALAAVLLAASPVWLWLAPTFYIDVPFALFLFAALALPSLCDAPRDEPHGPISPWPHGIALGAICGALAGAAAASKYPGLASGLVALGLLCALAPGAWRARSAGFAAGFALIAAAWYARTWALTGDPVYPILVGLFGAPTQVQIFAGKYLDMTRHWCGGGFSISDAFALPWRLMADPRAFCGDPGYALRLASIFALAALVLVPRARPLALAGVLLTALWFATTQQWRFLLPALCAMVVVAAVGAVSAAPRLRAGMTAILLGLCVFGVASDWLPALENEASNSIVPAFAYLTRAQTGADYLRARLEAFAAAEWFASNAPGAKVLALDDVRDYYFGPSVAWANPYYQARWQVDWRLPSALRYKPFTDAGFAYMVVNDNSAYVRRSPTGVDWAGLAADERAGRLRRVFAANSVTVYELK